MKKSILSVNKISEYVFKQIWIEFVKVCNIYEENPDWVYQHNDCRKREYVEIRHLTMFAVRENHPNYSLEKIRVFFELKQHATVIHGLKTINNLIESDKKYKGIVESILEQ